MICISSLDGSGGAEAASLVARAIGYRLIDEEIVMKAALEAGVEREVVADVERRRSLVLRIIEGLGSGGIAMGYGVPAGEIPGYGAPGQDELRGLIRSVIEETARTGSAVIAAHAASLALSERPDVLRVLVTASPQTRAERLAESLEIDAGKAAQTVKSGDAGRADYLRRFYGVSDELPTLYDLVVNTDRLTTQDAARLILDAAGAPAE